MFFLGQPLSIPEDHVKDEQNVQPRELRAVHQNHLGELVRPNRFENHKQFETHGTHPPSKFPLPRHARDRLQRWA